MKRLCLLAALAFCSLGASAQNQYYRCTSEDGKIVMQNFPCPSIEKTNATRATPARNLPSLTELAVKCSKLSKESTEYHTCAAQLSCREAGNDGSVFEDCVKKLTEGRRRSDLAAEEKTREAKAKARSVEASPNTGQVDCVDLYSYAKAKGHSYMEAVMIANESEKQGRCRRSK